MTENLRLSAGVQFADSVTAGYGQLREHSKVRHIVTRVRATPGCKAVVFSELREVLDNVGTVLGTVLGAPAVAEHYGAKRDEELQKFQDDPACHVLLLMPKGARGLDLSFATHIFLLNQIADPALLAQVGLSMTGPLAGSPKALYIYIYIYIIYIYMCVFHCELPFTGVHNTESK